jgi:hypothetical protein
MVYVQKRGPVKKLVPTLLEIKDKICKLRSNKHRLELRKIQIASRALNIDSKIKANEADIMKLTSVEEHMGLDSKDAK